MDTHTFTKTVESLESLSDASRARSLKIGELLGDEERSQLAARLTHFNERIRSNAVEAEQSLTEAERSLTEAQRAFDRIGRDEREAKEHRREEAAADDRINGKRNSSSSHS